MGIWNYGWDYVYMYVPREITVSVTRTGLSYWATIEGYRTGLRTELSTGLS
jgi:hypothetical protein